MCYSCDWEDFVDLLNEMLEDKEYEWAYDTIQGIKDTVEMKEHKTEGQDTAIDNIRDAVERRR